MRHLAKNYVISDDTLNCLGIDSILRRCLTLEEVESILNDFHSGACGGHISGLATTQKILRVCYFWPLIFKDFMEAVKKYNPCQIYTWKMHAHPTLIFSIIIVGPFTKWGIDL